MSVLPAQEIRRRKLITPFAERTEYTDHQSGLPYTFGLSSAGYDVRLDLPCPFRLSARDRQFVLGATLEHISMPDDLIARVADKSSLARQGIAVQNTVIEPGWHGYLTLEITYHGDGSFLLIPEMPIAQILFETLQAPTEQPYSGKYQGQQPGAQTAR